MPNFIVQDILAGIWELTVDFGLKDMETEECHAQYSEAAIKLEDDSEIPGEYADIINQMWMGKYNNKTAKLAANYHAKQQRHREKLCTSRMSQKINPQVTEDGITVSAYGTLEGCRYRIIKKPGRHCITIRWASTFEFIQCFHNLVEDLYAVSTAIKFTLIIANGLCWRSWSQTIWPFCDLWMSWSRTYVPRPNKTSALVALSQNGKFYLNLY